jgi:hypothetical protein
MKLYTETYTPTEILYKNFTNTDNAWEYFLRLNRKLFGIKVIEPTSYNMIINMVWVAKDQEELTNDFDKSRRINHSSHIYGFIEDFEYNGALNYYFANPNSVKLNSFIIYLNGDAIGTMISPDEKLLFASPNPEALLKRKIGKK